ncbi:MAG: hypothetical protein QOC89_3487 [Paraburkholderia sp.]|jgi:Domain of unknown function (DUF4148)|nr:hypothetical protein [Paraburkholderia sp.]
MEGTDRLGAFFMARGRGFRSSLLDRYKLSHITYHSSGIYLLTYPLFGTQQAPFAANTEGFAMLRSLIPAVALASTLAAPAVSFAQSNGSVTRAQARAELVQLEKAGYHVGDGDHATYPAGIQVAEARVAAQSEVTGSYGGVAGGVSASGAPTGTRSEATDITKSIYFGH